MHKIILQSGIIDTALSDHSMVYCTRKLTIRSLNKYSVDLYNESVERVSFPNYKNTDNSYTTYNDFKAMLDYVLNSIHSFKIVRVKNNTSEWFDREIAD